MTSLLEHDRITRLKARYEALLKGSAVPFRDVHRDAIQSAWDALVEPVKHGDVATLLYQVDPLLTLIERMVWSRQRLDATGALLQAAEFCLEDALCWALDDLSEGLPPLLMVEPISSPLYYPNSGGQQRASWAVGAGTASLPFPVVVCSYSMVGEPWTWPILYHELGHHIARRRGDVEAVAARYRELRGADADEKWAHWTEECVADFYAVLLGGPQAASVLEQALASRRSSDTDHPTGPDRVHVFRAALAGLRVRDSHAQVPDRSDRDAMASAIADHFGGWADRIEADARTALLPLDALPLRLVPGWVAAQADTPHLLRSRATQTITERTPARPWHFRAEHRSKLAATVKHLVETRLVDGPVPYKIPPVELMQLHDSISFVGASHHQLVPLLTEAFEARERAWRRLEFYSLADGPLGRLRAGDLSGHTLISARDEALHALAQLIADRGAAESVDFYIYDTPYLFASFWDVDSPIRDACSIPARIHVSTALWGADTRETPADDYVARAGEPLPTRMQQYVRALDALRASARAWAPDATHRAPEIPAT